MNLCTPHHTHLDILFRCRHGHRGSVVLSMNSPSPIMHKLINSFTLAIFMVLVLQRRVLVMGPRIILCGAIPIDSYIGGSGHRPLFREVVLSVLVLVVSCLPIVVSSLCVLSRVSAFWCVRLREGSSCFPLLFVKLAFSWDYGTTVACHGTTAGAVHSTTATSTTVIFYCRWKSGTTAPRAVLPPGRYYRDDPQYYHTVVSA